MDPFFAATLTLAEKGELMLIHRTMGSKAAMAFLRDLTKRKAINLRGPSKRSGTIWDSVKATQSVRSGTSIPRSFELIVGNNKFWVHPNATKHMAELLTKNGLSHSSSISSQTLLKSFHSAVSRATQNGYKSGELIRSGRWELVFGAGKTGDALPVIKHALYK